MLGAEYLIAFKAKAWLDLTARKAEGAHVNDRDLRKHKNDVFRLFAIVDPQVRIQLSPSVAEDMRLFLSAMEQETINLRALGIMDITVQEILTALRTMFLLT